MEEKERKKVPYYWGKLIAFTVLAVLIVIFREFHVTNLRYTVGALMLLYGIEEIIFEYIYYRHQFKEKSKTYIGIVELILGITLLLNKNMSYETVCVTWAVWSMIRESYELKEIVTELHFYIPRFTSLFESLAVFIFSVMLILTPNEHHAMTHIYLLFFELLLNPLVPLMDYYIGAIKNKDHKEIEE